MNIRLPFRVRFLLPLPKHERRRRAKHAQWARKALGLEALNRGREAYVSTVRHTMIEQLEPRVLLTTTVTFIAGGTDTWNNNSDNKNWRDALGNPTWWHDGYFAVFNTQDAYTVNLTENVKISGIRFEAGSVDIKPASAQTLTLYGTDTFTIEDQHEQPTIETVTVTNDTIEAQILHNNETGKGALVKTNTGAIALTNANDFPDGVQLNGGAITAAAGALGSYAITVTPGAGQTAVLAFQTDSTTLANDIAISSGTLRLDTQGHSVTLSGSLSGSSSTSLVVSDTLGNGAVQLTGTNSSLSAPITINSGAVKLGSASALGSGTLTLGGGTFDLYGHSYNPSSMTFTSGDITNSGGSAALTLTSTFTTEIDANKVGLISATISGGSAGLTAGGAGTLFLLARDNIYSGATTINAGATLVSRWNGLDGHYSIPGTPTVNGTLWTEYQYFGAYASNVRVWKSTTAGQWGGSATSWYALGSTGPTDAAWSDTYYPVFEEPVSGVMTVYATVTVGPKMIFLIGADRFDPVSGGTIALSNTAFTQIDIRTAKTSEYFYVPITCALHNGNYDGGLNIIHSGNLVLRASSSGYYGTTTLCNDSAINFSPGALGSDGPIEVTAGANGVAALVFAGPGTPPLVLSNPIDIVNGAIRIDPANWDVKLTGTISGDGKLLLGDTEGGGTVTLDPNNEAKENTYKGGTVIQCGTYIAGSDAILGHIPESPQTNITFDGNSVFQWNSGFTLNVNRNIVISSGYTATFDTSWHNDAQIDGAVSGGGNLTAVGTGQLTLNGENTFSGITTVGANETLRLKKSLALQDSTFDTGGGGSLSFDGLSAATLGGLQGSGNLWLQNYYYSAVALTVGGNNANTIMSGALRGPGSLTKIGSGTLALTGTTNDFTGLLKTLEGTLDVKTLGDDGSGCNGKNAITLSSADPETSGALKFSGTSTATISREIDLAMHGTLDASGTAALVINDEIVGSDGPNLTLRGTGTGRVNGRNSGNNGYIGITGMYWVYKEDAGTWILDSSSGYSHGMIVNGGTVEVDNADALTTGKELTIASAGHVVLASGLSKGISLSKLTMTSGAGEGDEENESQLLRAIRDQPVVVPRDLVPPVLTSIACVGPALAVPGTLQFAVTFSEAVNGVDVADFAPALVRTAGTITAVEGEGCRYTVTVSVSGTGTVGLRLVASGGTIADLAGNPLDATAAASVNQTYTVVAPAQGVTTLYWAGGDGDWTDGPWTLADGTPAAWTDGSNAVVGRAFQLVQASVDASCGSMGELEHSPYTINVSTAVRAASITLGDGAAITGAGTLTLPEAGTTITVSAGTAAIHATIAGSGALVFNGPATLRLDGQLACTGPIIVARGTLDIESPPAATPIIVGGRAVGPGAVFANDQTPLATLDTDVFNLVRRDFAAAETIDRAEMIEILRSVGNDGQVTDQEWAALRAVVACAATLNMPDYVRVLADDVVNGNPANAYYQGMPLGDLTAAATPEARADTLNILVGKWFLGLDHPMVPVGATYTTIAGPLFGDNPDPTLNVPSSADMHQGALADCYWVAAMGAIADSSANAIRNMFIVNGDGTYTIRWYYTDPVRGYVADYVTVDALLPGNAPGGLIYARQSGDKWWMPLAEKAYAQWNATGREGRDGLNSYASLGWGMTQLVDAQVLGRGTTGYSACTPGGTEAVGAAVAGHAAITVAFAPGDDPAEFARLGLVASHAYAVVGYDVSLGAVTVKNPWGFADPTAALTAAQMQKFRAWFIVADASGTVAAGGAAPALDGSVDKYPLKRALQNDAPERVPPNDPLKRALQNNAATSVPALPLESDWYSGGKPAHQQHEMPAMLSPAAVDSVLTGRA